MSKAPIQLDYASPGDRLIAPGWVTATTMIVVTCVGAFFATSMRTMEWGLDVRGFCALAAIFAIFLGPIVVLACLGRPRRMVILCVILVVMVPNIVAETWAGAQEFALMRRSGRKPGVKMTEKRWLFGDNWIATDGAGHYSGGD